METKGRLIAGSHNRNEFVLINADEIARVSVTWISSSSSSSAAAFFFFNCFADLNTFSMENSVSFGISSGCMTPFLHFEHTICPSLLRFDCDYRFRAKFNDPRWSLSCDSDSNGFSSLFPPLV